MKDPAITVLVLAAGQSRRFGSHKLLTQFKDDKPLIQFVLNTLQPLQLHTVVVIRSDDEDLDHYLSQRDVVIQRCPLAHLGMGSSLAWGVQSTRDSVAWLIALADMPLIQRRTFEAVIQSIIGGAPIAAPYYHGKRGHPVAFSQSYGPRLMQLTGDHGAREILHQEAHCIVPCLVDDAGIVVDIDTSEDLYRAM